jgi:hypothetical protein
MRMHDISDVPRWTRFPVEPRKTDLSEAPEHTAKVLVDFGGHGSLGSHSNLPGRLSLIGLRRGLVTARPPS